MIFNKGPGTMRPMGRATAPQAPNLATQTAGAFGGALQTTQQAIAGGAPLRQFMNPYTQNVVNTSMRDMNRARQMANNDVGAQAEAAGAFGGSRHGLVEAQTNAQFARDAGDMSAGLRYQGYRDAVGDRMGERQLRMNGAQQLSGLASQGMGFQSAIAGQQMQQGQQQRQMMQQLIDAQRGQFQGFTGQGGNALSGLLAAIGGVPYSTNSSTTQKPSIMQMLTSFL